MEKTLTALEAIVESVNLPGKRILDVGCGEGDISRALKQAGAEVIGIDPNPAQINYLLAQNIADDALYVQAPGEDLPFADESFDFVIYNNSLHLVPGALQTQALLEAVRVLKTDGQLYIANPLAEGPSHELKKSIGDEVYVQPSLIKAIAHIKQIACSEEAEFVYSKVFVLDDFEHYKNRTIRRGPYRKSLFAKHDKKIRTLFAKICPKVDCGFAIHQSILVNLLTKQIASQNNRAR